MKQKLILSCICLLLSCVTMNATAENMAIEWAPFIKVSGVTDKKLISFASVVNSDFLISQKGFIKRELIKKNDKEYADVIYWKTKNDAVLAGNKVSSCVKCNEYFSLMEMGKKAGEGFSHYTIIKSWKR